MPLQKFVCLVFLLFFAGFHFPVKQETRIYKIMEKSKAEASGSIVPISGKPIPLSQRLTALSVIFHFTAKSACVIFFSLRRSAINAPNIFASIYYTSFSTYNKTTHIYYQSTNNLFAKKALYGSFTYPKIIFIAYYILRYTSMRGK